MTDLVTPIDPVRPVLAARMRALAPSIVREILQAAAAPDVISFAGGLPAPEAMPSHVELDVPASCLQYGLTEGEPELRQAVSEYLRGVGLRCPAEQVLILSGSQQGLDLVAKLFVDPGSRVLVESPTYVAALQVFRLFGAELCGVPLESGPGFIGELARNAQAGARLAYLIPTFQNPTGHVFDADARDQLARVLDRACVPLFEDDPYRELAFDAPAPAPIAARLRRASWVYRSSFSKTFIPGLRLGFLAASPDLFAHLVRLKQAADLHSNRVSQWLARAALEPIRLSEHLARIRGLYRGKRDAFAAALERHFGADATWRIPEGGLFFWVRMNRALDTSDALAAALAAGVAYVPGAACFPDTCAGRSHMRLNFSNASLAQIDEGLNRLAELFRNIESQKRHF